MTPDGPRLLEVNARLAGAGNPAVPHIGTGASQVTRLVDVCAGRGPDLPRGYTLRRNVMAVFLMAHSTGVVLRRRRRHATVCPMARAATGIPRVPPRFLAKPVACRSRTA
jgi:biotin carboxylase